MAQTVEPVAAVLAETKTLFKKEFGTDATIAVCAPGRVNLIGEHTDYNDGFVMPMALPMVTVIVGAKSSESSWTIKTSHPDADMPHILSLQIPASGGKGVTEGPPKWSSYVRGVLANFKGTVPGFKAMIKSTVPSGGGLSSSAALEVAMYTFLEALTGTKSKPEEKALACQKAEHDFAHMPCGIMDQFISVMGKEGSALLIDCRSMTSTLIPMQDPNVVILITNSNVKHELTGSEYPSRRQKCQEAANLLNKKSLRDATMADVENLKAMKAPEETIKRARHAVSEILRTVEASEALKKKDYKKFGDLMVASHTSLRDDFNVSCPEVDQLVELALKVEGVLGSRMTGGGFGGCTVTLVEAKAVDNAIAHIKKNYKGTPTFYVCKPSDGAKIL